MALVPPNALAMPGSGDGGTALSRRLAFFACFWAFSAGLWLLLVDTVVTPELLAGAGVATFAAAAAELAREQRLARVSISPRWLTRAWRPPANVPRDIALVTVAAFRQLLRPRPDRGRLRVIEFGVGGDAPPDRGRRAIAEALGSLAPNTIVAGIDPERGLLVAHQLEPSDGPDDLDPLRLR
jgi:multisubunit Na+/H+ antiporter MnhE subunit